MSDLHELSAVAIGSMIATGEVSSLEATEHFLARIEAIDPQVGAFTTVDADGARKAAAEVGHGTGALWGVPMAIKDLEPTAGLRTTMGSGAFLEFVPPIDSAIVTTMRAGGAVNLGKTTTPEFGLVCYSEPDGAAPARTPWDLTRSPSGSSGGAAAAVAAGLVPWAQGGDGGGSIRTPASTCGIVGLKPSRGRISSGKGGSDAIGFSANGPLTRTVADAAAALDLMAGSIVGDTDWAPPQTFFDQCRPIEHRLRIARYTTPMTTVGADPECVAAVDRATEVLTSLGHEVEEIACPFPDTMAEHFMTVWSATAATVPLPPAAEELLRPITRYFRSHGALTTGAQVVAALGALREMARESLRLTATFDVVMTPTLAQPPRLVGELRNDADPEAEAAALMAFTPFTPPYNVSGQPGISLPLYWDESGLPNGVQFIGKPYAELTLLQLAAQLEQAAPWIDRKPPVW